MSAQTTPEYITAKSGLASWLGSSDHRRIGVLYLVSTLSMLLLGGALGLVGRVELLRPGQTLMQPEAYNMVFGLHGTIMLFLFLIPSVPATLGNFFLPLMIGAKNVAYPKLNLLSFYLYAAGGIFAIVAMFIGSDTGWTNFAPYDTTSGTPAIIVTVAVFVIALSTALTGLNFIATVRNLRGPGVTWGRLPLFVWGIFATAITEVFAALVLAVTLGLLIAEKSSGTGFFDPAMEGGDPLVFQRFFWAYLHPALYIMVLPAAAVVSEIISTFSRRKISGYTSIVVSTIAFAVLTLIVYGQHMFASGMSDYAVVVFSGLALLVAIPSGVLIFNWVATLYNGSVSLQSPMLYALGFVLLFTVGTLSGLFMNSASVGAYLHSTYFDAAHFHYAVLGTAAVGFIGGLHYWWPKITGKMFHEQIAKVAFGLTFVGFNMAFLTQFLLGSRGMPQRSYDYIDSFEALQGFSTVGSFLLAAGVLLMVGMFIHSLKKGAAAPPNPWGSAGFEWATDSAALTRGPYDYHLASDEELFDGFPEGGAPAPAPKAAAAAAPEVAAAPVQEEEE